LNHNHKSITEGFAIELFLDAEAEKKVLAFRDLIYLDGVQPVQGLMNDKPHISLAVFPQVNGQKLLKLTEEFAQTLTSFEFRLAAVGTFPTAEMRERLRTLYELDKPMHVQYFSWLKKLPGELGRFVFFRSSSGCR